MERALAIIAEKQDRIEEITALAISHRDKINEASRAISNGLIWVKDIPRSYYIGNSFSLSNDPYEKLRAKYNNLVGEHNDLVERFNAAVERSNDLSDIINSVMNALNN